MTQKTPIGNHTVSCMANICIWIGLLVLTGITVYVAGIDLGRFGIVANILIASVKAGLVLYIFMHLKYESRVLKFMLTFVVLTLTTIIVLTFLDVLYRY